MKKYCIQSKITHDFLSVMSGFGEKLSPRWTDDNSSVKDIMNYDTKEEAEQDIETYEMYSCEVVEMPESLLADHNENQE